MHMRQKAFSSVSPVTPKFSENVSHCTSRYIRDKKMYEIYKVYFLLLHYIKYKNFSFHFQQISNIHLFYFKCTEKKGRLLQQIRW